MAAGQNIFEAVGIAKDFHYLGAAALTGGVLLGVGLHVRAKAARAENGDVLPEPKFSLFNLFVEILLYFRNLLKGMIGHHSDKYLPIIVTTFVLIFFSNFSGLLPGLLSATADFNNNLAMGLFMFAIYHYYGLKEHGLHYFKQFTGGLPVPGYGIGMTLFMAGIAGLLIVIELVGHLVRPFSLTLRLWGVVNGDHALEGVVSGLIPLFVPMLAMGLGLIVCVVQALVFTLLSSVYIQLAVSHDH